jgi:tryptophan-rich sensory protein
MMGVAFYLMYTSSSDKEQKNKSKRVYASQLILNFLWPVLFFSLKAFWAAALCLVFLILMLIKTYKEFKISDNRAALLLIPYMAWCFFALYLNIGIAILN